MSDLAKRLEIKASMIELCERIECGSDSAIMREAATELRRLTAERDELFEAMQHPSYEEKNRLRAELAAQKRRAETAEQALADLGMTPEEARAGVERSNANRRDAERYRFLRAENEKPYEDGGWFVGLDSEDGGDWIGCDLDAAIDSAMTKAQKGD